jgi:uncharacterized DUF497 family protein
VKDAINRRKHGLPLSDGVSALEDPQCGSWYDLRFDYGEERMLTLGLSPRGVLLVVSTLREFNLTRIISVRKAKNYEIDQYGQSRT